MSKEIWTVKDIQEAIEAIAPIELQESWDNSGLILGFEDKPVNKILTCLEINGDVAEEAINVGADMIISHHPLIFAGVSKLNNSVPKDSVIMTLIAKGISVYSSHTPFDKTNGGNNDALAGILELKNITDLSGAPVPTSDEMIENPSEDHIGRMGNLKKKMTLSQVIDLVCQNIKINPSQISAVGNLGTEITKIGLCTGAGSEFVEQAYNNGCQLFITGDVKYHQAQDAKDLGMCVIDAGHYGTEKIFPAVMNVQLEKILGNDVELIRSQVNLNPFTV